jgi:hypothetical protein
MITGHTKFAPDGCFGLLKRAFKRHAVSSLEEFETVVNESACVNQAQLIGKEDGRSFVAVGEWQQHLSPYFKPFPGIKQYQHFRFDASFPGFVFAKITTESEEIKFNLMKGGESHLPKQGPQQIIPPGLPLQRQWYLYNQIREYVKDGLQDVVCPRPLELVAAESGSDTDQYEPGFVAQPTAPKRGRGRGRVVTRRSKRSRHSSSESEKDALTGVKETRGRGRLHSRGRGRGRGRGQTVKEN